MKASDPTSYPASSSSQSDPQIVPRRLKGRIWTGIKLIIFLGTLVCIFQGEKVWASVLLLATLLMGFYTSFKIQHQDIEQPYALFWLGIGEKLLANLIIFSLFLRQLNDVNAPFPSMLCAGFIIVTIRNLFYLIFSIVLLKESKELLKSSNWGKVTTLSMNVTMILYVWDAVHFSRISMAISILLMIVTTIGYLYFYYRDKDSRKPLSVASQLTVSRIVLSPAFIWVFFYDSDLVYQNNHLIFKILALVLSVLFVVSDGLDGYLARKMGQVTNLGKLLDPFSDKISNMSIFLCFLASDFASVWMVALIYFREATVETLRTLAAAQGIIIDARPSGKWKTALQGTAFITILVLAIADHLIVRYWPDLAYWALIWNYLPYGLMTGVTIITLISGVDYILGNKKVLQQYF